METNTETSLTPTGQAERRETVPSTKALLKAYGNIPQPDSYDSDRTYQEVFDRDLDRYSVRVELMRLWERDAKTIKED